MSLPTNSDHSSGLGKRSVREDDDPNSVSTTPNTKRRRGASETPVAATLRISETLEDEGDYTKWTQAETRNGRRLLRFTRQRDTRYISLSYTAVTRIQANADERGVVSCILVPGATAVYVTCTDLVRLIFLATDGYDGPIPRNFRGRTRRALDACDPFTVKKKEPSHSHIFDFIDRMQAPRAIHASTDFKILPWSKVRQSLTRVVDRFVYFAANDTFVEPFRVSLPKLWPPPSPEVQVTPSVTPISICPVPGPADDDTPPLSPTTTNAPSTPTTPSTPGSFDAFLDTLPINFRLLDAVIGSPPPLTPDNIFCGLPHPSYEDYEEEEMVVASPMIDDYVPPAVDLFDISSVEALIADSAGFNSLMAMLDWPLEPPSKMTDERAPIETATVLNF